MAASCFPISLIEELKMNNSDSHRESAQATRPDDGATPSRSKEDFESAELGEYRVFKSDAVFITAGGGTCYVEHAPAGMSGKALRVTFGTIIGRADTVVSGYKTSATSISFKYIAPIDLTFVYVENGNIMRAPLPAGTRTFTMTGMSGTSTTITTDTSPVTFWLDDILFE
jgi:hypothetical protein